MVDGVGGNMHVQNQSFLSRIGDTITSGLKTIGKAFVEFGTMISDGFKSIFSSAGKAGTNAPDNAQQNAPTTKVLKGETFTVEEKRQHMEQALSSDFYKSLEGSSNGYINQARFESIAESILSTPSNVAGMKAYGVSLDEVVAISMYTSQAFVDVNDALRNNTGDKAMEGLAKAFTDGLAKLPSFSGNPVEGPDGNTYHQCWRGAKLPKDVGSQYLEGTNVSDPGIMSTTFKKSESFPNCNYQMVMLLKPGSEGKDISMFSDKPTECEVAFPPGVQFQVVSRQLDSGGLLPPEMEKTYHPGFQGSNPMGVVDLVMKEV